MGRVHKRTLAGIVQETVEAEGLPNGFTFKIKPHDAERSIRSNATKRYDRAELLKKTPNIDRSGEPVRMSRLCKKIKKFLYLDDDHDVTFISPDNTVIPHHTYISTVRGMEGLPSPAEEFIQEVCDDAMDFYKDDTDRTGEYCVIYQLVVRGLLPNEALSLTKKAYEEMTDLGY